MRYTLIVLALVALVLVDLALTSGCAATSRQLELCYARADARFGLDSERHCPAREPWSECPDATRLEAEHWTAYEQCLAEEEGR